MKTMLGHFAGILILVSLPSAFIATPSLASESIDPRLALKPSREAARGLALSPDSAIVAVAVCGPEIKLIDTQSGECVSRLGGLKEDVQIITFSPDGKTIAASGWDPVVRLWDIGSHAQRKEIDARGSSRRLGAYRLPPNYSFSLAFAPDGLSIACGQTGRVGVWTLKESRQSWEAQIPHGAFALGYSDDGEKLAVGTGWGDLYLLDVASGQVRRLDEGHHRLITSVKFMDGGRKLVSSSTDHRILVWDAMIGRRVKTLHEDVESGCLDRIYSTSFVRCSKLLVTASNDGVVRLWDIENGRLTKKLTLNLLGHDIAERKMVLSPEALKLAVATSDGYLLIYDLKDDVRLREEGQIGVGEER